MKKFYILLTLIVSLFLLVGCQETAPEGDVMEKVPVPTEPEVKEVEVEETAGITYTVDITDDGFLPEESSLKVGDTVKWVNARTEGNALSQALVVGIQTCKVESPILKIGESFEYTFEEPETCKLLEGITTSQFSTVIVEGDVMEK